MYLNMIEFQTSQFSPIFCLKHRPNMWPPSWKNDQPQYQLCKQWMMGSWINYFSFSEKISWKIHGMHSLWLQLPYLVMKIFVAGVLNPFISMPIHNKSAFSAYQISKLNKPHTVTSVLTCGCDITRLKRLLETQNSKTRTPYQSKKVFDIFFHQISEWTGRRTTHLKVIRN